MSRPAQIIAYAASLPLITAPKFVGDGNSLTVGTGSTTPATDNYVTVVTGLLGGSWTSANTGVNGQGIAEMITRLPTAVYPALGALKARTVIACWEGTNTIGAWVQVSLSYASIGDIFNDHVTYIEKALQYGDGTKVVLLTVMPRTLPFTAPQATLFESYRGPFNTLLRNYAAANSSRVALADIAADSILGTAGAQNDATWFSDTCHLTTAGYARVASIVHPIVAAM